MRSFFWEFMQSVICYWVAALRLAVSTLMFTGRLCLASDFCLWHFFSLKKTKHKPHVGFEVFLDGQRHTNWRGDSFEMPHKLKDANILLAVKLAGSSQQKFQMIFSTKLPKAFFFSIEEHKLLFSRESLGQRATTLSAIRQMRDGLIFPFFCVLFVVFSLTRQWPW